MPHKSDVCTQALTNEDLSAMRTIVRAIPDGIYLASFPEHCEGADCWCRPQICMAIDKIVVNHKDLSKGEFDC